MRARVALCSGTFSRTRVAKRCRSHPDDLRENLIEAEDAKSLAAGMRKVLHATAITDRETHAFVHRLHVVVSDMSVALASTEAMLPAK
jgi:hypothetical protein